MHLAARLTRPGTLLVVVLATLVTELALYARLYRAAHPAQPEYSYIGDDHPRALPVAPMETVAMRFEESFDTAYLLGEAGDADYASLLPHGSHIVHLGPNNRPFSVSLFHQLACLDVVRRSLNETTREPAKAKHCYNYLRQMILCRGNLREEPAQNIYVSRSTITAQSYMCKDWRAPYRAAEESWRTLHSSTV